MPKIKIGSDSFSNSLTEILKLRDGSQRAQRLVAEEAESEEKWAGALQKGRSETLSAARIAGDNWVTEAEKASETTKGIPAKSRYPIDFVGAPRGIRTPDPLLRRQLLYPAEL